MHATSGRYRRRLGRALLIPTLALLFAGQLHAGPFDGWARKLTITYTNYTGTAELTNFPVLIKLSPDIEGFSYDDFASPAGGDLRFADAVSSNELVHEVDGWHTGGTSYVWVTVPAFTNGATIDAYWGKTGEQAPAYATNGATWDDTFRAVWHLGGEGASSNVTDSTSNAVDGVGQGVTGVDGFISGGRDFEGASRQYVNFPGTPGSAFIPVTNSPISLSCWVKPESIGTGATANRMINIHRGVGGSALAFGLGQSSKVNVYKPDGSVLPSAGALALGGWRHLAVTFDGAAFRLYLDGAFDNSHTNGLDAGSTTTVKMGTFDGNGYFFDGLLDEMRVANVARSADWLRACWLNQASNELFCAYGYVEELDRDPNLPLIRTLPATLVMTTSATLNGDLVSTGAAPVTVRVYMGPEDMGTNAGLWAQEIRFYDSPPQGLIATNIAGLTSGAVHHYRYRAANAHGEVWSRNSRSFTTDGPPLVDNTGETPGVAYALLNGTVTTNGAETSGAVYWGPVDGGTNALAWANTNALAGPLSGAFFADTRPRDAWQSGISGLDVDNPGLAGSASEAGGVWRVSGGGRDIYGTADQFHFASRSADGDFDVHCRVGHFVGGNNDYRKAGLMLRRSFSAGSPHVSVLRTPTNLSRKVVMVLRSAEGAATTSDGPTGMTNLLYWVRLVREGNLFTGYWAEDNAGAPGAWAQIGDPRAVSMPREAHLGLAVSAHNNAQLTTVAFDGFGGDTPGTGNLLFGAPYYYRCYATNAFGGRWAPATKLFTTAPPPGIGIANHGPSDVAPDSVMLNGWLGATGSVFDVSLLWGGADGGAGPYAWANTNAVGSYTNLNAVSLSNVVSSLGQGTWYGTFLASNAATNMVAAPSEQFQPLGDPVISNRVPADIGDSSATLNGYLAAGGAGDTTVYWGLTDGQDRAGAWAGTNSVGSAVALRVVPASAAGLLANGAYYSRWYVTNAVGTDWADSSLVFTTAPPTVALGDIALREGDDGSAVARFPVMLTTPSAIPVSIDFATSNGTAQAGSDYVATNGTLTIPAGEAAGTIDVRLVADRQPETLYERFFVNVGSPVDCTLSNTLAACAIEDDDIDSVVSAWSYRMKITLGDYTGSETLTNFPVLVKLDESMTGFRYGQFASVAGDDLRFTDAGSTQILSHDIEAWDRGGISCVWVRVPEISGNQTTIWAYWGNSGASAPSAAETGATWGEEYLGVYHLHADANDSTTNANHGADTGVLLRNTGVAGNGIDVSGGAHVNIQGGTRWERLDTNHVDRFTFSAWVNPDTLALDQSVFGRFGGHSLVWLDALNGGGGLTNYVVYSANGNTRTLETTGAPATQDTWQYVVATGDGVTMRIYVDGQFGSASPGDYQYNPSTVSISLGTTQGANSGRALDGSLDEARIAAAARSEDWITAEYRNVADHDNFVTYSPAEALKLGTVLLVR
jgi:hypothetical protein